MCFELENFVKNFHLLVLPSTLWGVHVDPRNEFVAILHVSVACNKVTVDKGVLLTPESGGVKASVSLYDEIVHIPNTTGKMSSISDLSALLYSLHDVKFCMNLNNADYPKCSKYVLNSDESSLCDFCAIDVFSGVKNECDSPELDPTPALNEEIYYQNQDYNSPGKMASYTCDLCSDAFDSFDLFTKHRESHGKERNLCTACGKTFGCASTLADHMLTHSNDRPFKCAICDKSFAKKYNLNVHTRVHSGERPYVCSKCGKTFSTRSNLSTHMSSHSSEKRHVCELCNMTFVHPRVLRIHMRKHTGEKPFMCQICGKVFSKNIHLTIHTRTHTGEKPHVCPVCGKGFTTTGNLNSHRKNNHT